MAGMENKTKIMISKGTREDRNREKKEREGEKKAHKCEREKETLQGESLFHSAIHSSAPKLSYELTPCLLGRASEGKTDFILGV